jgi:hypothetical protein
MNHKKYFFAYLILFFFIDLCIAAFFSYPYIDLLFCLFIISCLSGISIVQRMVLILFLISTDLLYGYSWLLSLGYFLSFMAFLAILRQFLNTSLSTVYYLALIVGLITKNLIMQGCLSISHYTIYEFFATLIMMHVVLKYTSKGRLGNRL